MIFLLQEPNNLTNLSTFRYSGLVHNKTLSIVPSDKTGFTVIYKKHKFQHQPAKNTVKITLKHGARRSLGKLRNILKNNKYRSDLRQVKCFFFFIIFLQIALFCGIQ